MYEFNLTATLPELIARIEAIPKEWRSVFGARYYDPDPPATYIDSPPAINALLEQYPQRHVRLGQLKEEYNELLKTAGKLAGASADEDALVYLLNRLRHEEPPLPSACGTQRLHP